MWQKSYSIVSQLVTKEQMWQLWCNVNQWHTWDSGIDYAKMDGDFVKGNTFILKPKNAPKVKIELIEVEPYRKFTDLTRFPGAKMYGIHTFEETSEGLKMTITMQMEGFLGLIWRKLVAEDIVKNLAQDMQNQIERARKIELIRAEV